MPRSTLGKELISHQNSVADGDSWLDKGAPHREITVGNEGQTYDAIQTRLQQRRDGTTRLVWHWYYVGGIPTADKYMAKMIKVWATIQGHERSAVVAFASNGSAEDPGTIEVLQTFAEDMVGSVEAHVR
jgi:EpsI family protein